MVEAGTLSQAMSPLYNPRDSLPLPALDYAEAPVFLQFIFMSKSTLTTFITQLHRNLRQNLTAMTSTPEPTSLSARSPTPTQGHADPKHHHLEHAPAAKSLQKQAHKQLCTVKPLSITASKPDPVKSFAAYLHIPQNYHREATEGREKTAAILMSGASGGVAGPSSMYLSIADKVASLRRGIPVLRMDYRYPARNKYCVPDVLAAMDYLKRGFAVERFVLVGWSFGGAPVLTVGGMDERVVGCAVVASQTEETEGMRRVGEKSLPLLLMHGTADAVLGASGSESLFERYKRCVREDCGELRLFEGDDHALTRNSREAEAMLCAFIMKCAGEEVAEDEGEVLEKTLVGEEEKVKVMEEAGDLGEPESVR